MAGCSLRRGEVRGSRYRPSDAGWHAPLIPGITTSLSRTSIVPNHPATGSRMS